MTKSQKDNDSHIKCPNCGDKRNRPWWIFCQACGEKLPTQEPTLSDPTTLVALASGIKGWKEGT